MLFLSAAYPHKNFQILPKVLIELKKRKLDQKIHFFLTIPKNSSYGKKVLQSLFPFSDLITNLGELKNDDVPGAFSSSTALFIPTLVESFGLIYLEAMKYKCPILTSDRDFSRWMCGKLAMYFDPLDHISIADTLEKYIENPSFHKHNKNVNQRLFKKIQLLEKSYAKNFYGLKFK